MNEAAHTNESPQRSSPLRWILPAGITVVVAVVLLLVLVPAEKERLYRETIESHRRQIESFLRLSPESPLPVGEKRVFTGLEYFDIDRSYSVEARLELIDEQPVFPIPTTGDTQDLYERFAWADFELLGDTYRLLVLRGIDVQPSNRLFLAFTDRTNGTETYIGGRYIDLYYDPSGVVTIDFNRAYNPYCVYDPAYICPLAPPENVMPIRIEAGEHQYRLKASPENS